MQNNSEHEVPATPKMSDIKPILKTTLDDIIKDPEKFGITDKDAQQALQDMNGLAKTVFLKLLKNHVGMKYDLLNSEKLAAATAMELHASYHHKITAKTIELMLKKPDDPKYGLDSELITQIKSLDKDEKNDLKLAIMKEEGLKTFGQKVGELEHQMLVFFEKTFGPLIPVLELVLNKILHVGATTAQQHLPAIKGLADGAVDTLADKVIEPHLPPAGKEISDKVQEEVKTVVGTAIETVLDEAKKITIKLPDLPAPSEAVAELPAPLEVKEPSEPEAAPSVVSEITETPKVVEVAKAPEAPTSSEETPVSVVGEVVTSV